MEQPSRTRQVAVLAAGAAALAAVGGCVLHASRRRSKACRGQRVRILYGSATGTSEKWARQLREKVMQDAAAKGRVVEVSVEDLATFAFDLLLSKASISVAEVVVVMLSTYEGGLAPENCVHFSTLLEDHLNDFRVSQDALAHLHFAVAGFGSREYEAVGHFCTAAQRVDAGFGGLAALRLVPLLRISDTDEASASLAPWTSALLDSLQRLAEGIVVKSAHGPMARGAAGAISEHDDGSESESDGSVTTAGDDAASAKAMSDMEELVDSCGGQAAAPKKEKEMLTERHKAQLKKEGYKLIGTHSAVKLCRWTKHHLRGRGGCYKHSFYGITSSQCMEATPSLACANKCTFCWRHHKNPVSTSWKWRADPPAMIVADGIEAHKKMIRECKGIPGVKKDRFQEALTVKHCALSLVGEPIMYPQINELVQDLHSRSISTFLVTNAQFPDAIHSLTPVTQLYVSVDAGTKENLKAIDRPLFADFWERYIESLKALKEKKQRTVYRLTLVKDQNMTNAEDYGRLVALGEPDFIEIKSVTFCGESKASSLSMSSVPWHEEVKMFAEAMLGSHGLADRYELSCEHKHSNIVLISQKKYKIEGRWHTWIDYPRFFELLRSGEQFCSLDYAALTPDWAIYGSEEAGFDPVETRVYHNRTVKRAKQGLLSAEQLRQYPTDPALSF